MAKRLTKKQKSEILEGYRNGKSFSILAKEFSCSPNTISRTVKGLLSLQESDSSSERSGLKHGEIEDDQIIISATKKNSETHDQDISVNRYNSSLKESEESLDLLVKESSSDSNDDVFQELVPLVSGLEEWENQKQVACNPLTPDLLPAVVYMVVDKKVELEPKKLKEFSQWSFLPDQDQNRLVINLFSNQRAAKRSCSRNQRVIKVPNPLVFMLSSPFLIDKGITRLLLDDSLIALDES